MKTEEKKAKQKRNKNTFQVISEYIQALVGAILLAVLIRGFLVEPFKIPSESMVPTLLVGDHIFVARYQYGLRVPLTKLWVTEFDDPERGDVVVFSYPEDEKVDFIKRIVGVPGDKITMDDGILYVNGKPSKYQNIEMGEQVATNKCVLEQTTNMQNELPKELLEFPYYLKYKKFVQQLETFPGGKAHIIQRSRGYPDDSDFEITVPDRNYFVMGDNRDYSKDSRFWGFVPRENLKGKAVFVWLSLNHEKIKCANNIHSPTFFPNVRWDRFGRKIL